MTLTLSETTMLYNSQKAKGVCLGGQAQQMLE